jgi:hypothetical protein
MRELSRERELKMAAERDARLWGLLRGLEAAEERAEREADARARGCSRKRRRSSWLGLLASPGVRMPGQNQHEAAPFPAQGRGCLKVITMRNLSDNFR